MKQRITIALAVTILLAGCAIPGLPSLPGSQQHVLSAKSAEELQQLQSLPFTTLLFDGPGVGRYFQAGESEKVVLNAKADLDAFLSRHPRVTPDMLARPIAPMPQSSATPPPAPPPVSAPPPEMERLPDALTQLDFGKYQAIAFFDGAVKLAATSRIVAVEERPEQLVVHTMRWEPPPNPASADAPRGRVHIVKLPRTDKPVLFAETIISNEVADEMEGGVGVGANPRMNPRWKAVPNPEITREMVEQQARGMARVGPDGTFSFEKRTLRWIHENLKFENVLRGPSFTPDSEVWLAIAEGDLDMTMPSHLPPPGQIGGTPPKTSRAVMLFSIEDGMMISMMAQETPGEPGFRFHPKPGPYYLGDPFTFDVEGEPIEGSLTLKLAAAGKEWVRELAYRDLAGFRLILDPAHLPGLADVPVQTLNITIQYGHGTIGMEIPLIRDRDALSEPPIRAAGPGRPNEFGTAPADGELDAFARDIAAKDWQGKNLTITSRTVERSEVETPNFADRIPAEVQLRRYEIRGEFPKFLVPAVASSTGELAVMAPKRLVIVLSESTPIHVALTRAYAE